MRSYAERGNDRSSDFPLFYPHPNLPPVRGKGRSFLNGLIWVQIPFQYARLWSEGFYVAEF